MSKIERAWLGAFIEADGSAFISGRCRDILTVQIGQKDVEAISTALRLTQTGSVMYSKADNAWLWRASSNADAVSIAKQCAPYSWKLQAALKEYADV